LKKSENNLEGYNTPMVRREANYYIGNNLKNKGDYDAAFSYFKKCIEDSRKIDGEKESGFRINAALYSGTILEAKGKFSEAKKYYQAVLDMREFNNSHTLAETYLARIDKLEKGSK
jgi:tetratricopeptide (TPR) repeat protein